MLTTAALAAALAAAGRPWSQYLSTQVRVHLANLAERVLAIGAFNGLHAGSVPTHGGVLLRRDALSVRRNQLELEAAARRARDDDAANFVDI